MTSAQLTAAAAIAAALILAAVVGALHNRRSGTLRDTAATTDVDTTGLGLSSDAPTIVHFTATWCGPCAAVRRVVDQVCADLPAVAHVEIDLDANPDAARAALEQRHAQQQQHPHHITGHRQLHQELWLDIGHCPHDAQRDQHEGEFIGHLVQILIGRRKQHH